MASSAGKDERRQRNPKNQAASAGGVALISSRSHRVGAGSAGRAVEKVAPQKRHVPPRSPAVGAPHLGHTIGVPSGTADASRWKVQYSAPTLPRSTRMTTPPTWATASLARTM